MVRAKTLSCRNQNIVRRTWLIFLLGRLLAAQNCPNLRLVFVEGFHDAVNVNADVIEERLNLGSCFRRNGNSAVSAGRNGAGCRVHVQITIPCPEHGKHFLA